RIAGRRSGANIETLLRTGDARDVILDVARDVQADLIAMGTHGRRGVRRALIGSIAEGVLRAAPGPVLTVRGQKGQSGVRIACLLAFRALLVPLLRSLGQEPDAPAALGPRESRRVGCAAETRHSRRDARDGPRTRWCAARVARAGDAAARTGRDPDR